MTEPYQTNIFIERKAIKEALEAEGLIVEVVNWADPDVKWENGKIALFRTTWDYFERFDEFEPWLKSTAEKIQFINPVEQIIWNMDKRYLADMESWGVPIVPTYFIQPGDKRSLADVLDALDWKKTILKPAIAGGARHTYRLEQSNCTELEGIYRELIAKECMLIQPFIETILDQGEVSYMVFGGTFSHAILKKAKAGDFRVQDDFGGSVHDYSANQEEIDFSENAARACTPVPAYARVDVMLDKNGKMMLSEIEMIEPELWFRNNAEAAHLLAAQVAQQIETIQS